MIVRISRDLHPARLLPSLALCACVATVGCNTSARLAGRLPHDRGGTEEDPFLVAAARADRNAGRASLDGEDLAPADRGGPARGSARFAAAAWDPLTGMPVADGAAPIRGGDRVATRTTVRPTAEPAWADDPPADPFGDADPFARTDTDASFAAADVNPFYDGGAGDPRTPGSAPPAITRINPFAETAAAPPEAAGPLRTASLSDGGTGDVIPAGASSPVDGWGAADGPAIVRAEYTAPSGGGSPFADSVAANDGFAPAGGASSIEMMTAEFLAEPDAPPAVQTTAMFATAGANPFADSCACEPAGPAACAAEPAARPKPLTPAQSPTPAKTHPAKTPAAQPEADDFTPPTPVIGPAGDGWQPVRG